MEDQLLLDLLNTTPVIDGAATDALSPAEAAATWILERGGRGATTEVETLREVRADLQAAVRGERTFASLSGWLSDVSRRPEVTESGVEWELTAPEDRLLAARAVLALAEVEAARPGRLRPCGNGECQLFFLDRSQAGRARWCSMATCGNRMKARRHQQAAKGR